MLQVEGREVRERGEWPCREPIYIAKGPWNPLDNTTQNFRGPGDVTRSKITGMPKSGSLSGAWHKNQRYVFHIVV